jgi:hypothetical protein
MDSSRTGLLNNEVAKQEREER